MPEKMPKPSMLPVSNCFQYAPVSLNTSLLAIMRPQWKSHYNSVNRYDVIAHEKSHVQNKL